MTGKAHFNLLDEPWIPVLCTGEVVDVSIMEALDRAAEIDSLAADLSSQRFAITRLLLAVIHRAVDGPTTWEEWKQLWTAPALPMDQIRAYAEKHHERFFLRHADQPFFQTPTLRTGKGEWSSLRKIVADLPAGHPLFTNRFESDVERMTPAEAARWLVHVQAFDTSGIKSGAVGDARAKGGRGYPIGPAWAGQLGGVLAQGLSLRETLLLNLLGYEDDAVTIGSPSDLPAWERPVTDPTWSEATPQGAISLYTWQSRRVLLRWDEDHVTGVVLANGDKLTPQFKQGLEPHTVWRYSEPQSKKFGVEVFMPAIHDPSRQAWRGLSRLLGQEVRRTVGKKETPKPPESALVAWVQSLVANGAVDKKYPLVFASTSVIYGSHQSVTDEIVDDSVAVPAAVTVDGPLRELVLHMTADTDTAVSAYARFADNLAIAAGGDDKLRGDNARETAFSALDLPIRAWLADLSPDSDVPTARRAWHVEADAILRQLAAQQIASLGPRAWSGGRGDNPMNPAQAEMFFKGSLKKALYAAYAGSNSASPPADTTEHGDKESTHE